MFLHERLILPVLLFPLVVAAVGEFPPDTPSIDFTLRLSHTPVSSCQPYRELLVAAELESPPAESLSATIHFRALGDSTAFYIRPMEPFGRNMFRGAVPARVVGNMGVEYYLEARAGSGTTWVGSPDSTLQVPTAYRLNVSEEIPDELPGDDYLHQFDPIPDPRDTFRAGEAARENDKGGNSLGVQIVVILVLGALGYLLYQRFVTT